MFWEILLKGISNTRCRLVYSVLALCYHVSTHSHINMYNDHRANRPAYVQISTWNHDKIKSLRCSLNIRTDCGVLHLSFNLFMCHLFYLQNESICYSLGIIIFIKVKLINTFEFFWKSITCHSIFIIVKHWSLVIYHIFLFWVCRR